MVVDAAGRWSKLVTLGQWETPWLLHGLLHSSSRSRASDFQAALRVQVSPSEAI
jgi:hypothetical protein